MPAPYLNLNGVKIAPFKNPNTQPYGSFANTTPVGAGAKEYRIQQTVSVPGQTLNFNWPSSEHAYHAQKIIYLMNKLPERDPAQQTLTNMLKEIEAINEEFSPRKHYDGLVNRYIPELNQKGLNVGNKKAFDKLCDADYHAIHNPTGGKKSVDFMRTIIQLKLAQHPVLAEKAMECAKDGVLPVEVSQYDSNWASGPDGQGENMLGILILEEGNKLLIQKGGTPAIPNPQSAYQSLRSTQNLSHNNLDGTIYPSPPNWVIPSTGSPSVTTTNPMNTQSQPKSSQYYESRGGNQRLVINQNKVVGYEFRKDSTQPWQKSGDPARFQGLETAFNNNLINKIKPYYQPATLDKGRTHLWEAKSFKSQFQALKGDALKTKILSDFKSKLDNCSSSQDLEETVKRIKGSEEFKVLAQSQGLVTYLFNLKTSSVEALESMIEDKSTQLSSSIQNRK